MNNLTRGPQALLVVLSLIPIANMATFFAGVRKTPILGASLAAIGLVTFVLLAGMILLVVIARKNDASIPIVIWLTCYVVATVLAFFFQYYWLHRSGFAHMRTRFDAAYFTIGTVTGGTGDMIAMSEDARGLQAAQELVDLLLLVVVAGVVVARLVSTHAPETPAPH